MYSNPDTSIILGKQALALAEKLVLNGDEGTEDLKNKANTLSNLGVYHIIKSEYETALDHLHQSLVISESLGDKKGMAASYNNIGEIYRHQSDYPQALDYYFKSLKIGEAILSEGEGTPANKQSVAAFYNNIGIIYFYQSDYPLALDYFFKSLKIKEELGNKQGMAISYVTIGNLFTAIYGEANSIEMLGGWAAENPAKILDTAMYYQQQALLINKELSDEYNMTFSLSGIASILMQKGKYNYALEYYHQSALLADSIGALQQESDAHSGLAECY